MQKNTPNPNFLSSLTDKSNYPLHILHKYLEKRENDILCKHILNFTFRLYIRYKAPVKRSTVRRHIKEYNEIYKISHENNYLHIDPSTPHYSMHNNIPLLRKTENIHTISLEDIIEIRKIPKKGSSIILLQIITRDSLVYYLTNLTPHLSCTPAYRHSIQGNPLTGFRWYMHHHFHRMWKRITK